MSASAEDQSWINGEGLPGGQPPASEPVDPAALAESIGVLCIRCGFDAISPAAVLPGQAMQAVFVASMASPGGNLDPQRLASLRVPISAGTFTPEQAHLPMPCPQAIRLRDPGLAVPWPRSRPPLPRLDSLLSASVDHQRAPVLMIEAPMDRAGLLGICPDRSQASLMTTSSATLAGDR